MAGSRRTTNRGRRSNRSSSYQRRRQSTTKRTQQPRPNKKKRARKQPRTAPPWVWFLSGLALATAVAAIAYIIVQPGGGTNAGTSNPNGAPRQSETTSQAVQSSGQDTRNDKASASAKDKKGNGKPRFGFYRMLPNYHATIDQASGAPASQAGTTQNSRASTGQPTKQSSTTRQSSASSTSHTSTNSDANGPWRIQVGAFSDRSAAQQRVARITLLGVDAKLSKQTLTSGKTLYRVQSKPIKSRQRLDKLRSKLRAKNINLVVRNL